MRTQVDVYGRFVVHVERSANGAWELYKVGRDGKRGRIEDVVAPPDADLALIVELLEAAYHEDARPGTDIRVIE